MADTLDGISAGVFLVDGDGRIVHANASGEALLHQRSVLRAGGGRLAAIAADANQELSRLDHRRRRIRRLERKVAMPLAARR